MSGIETVTPVDQSLYVFTQRTTVTLVSFHLLSLILCN